MFMQIYNLRVQQHEPQIDRKPIIINNPNDQILQVCVDQKRQEELVMLQNQDDYTHAHHIGSTFPLGFRFNLFSNFKSSSCMCYGHLRLAWENPLPPKYAAIFEEPCTQVIGTKEQNTYISEWNNAEDLKINLTNYNRTQQIDMLKVLHLYYNGGIYSDFDTEINRSCIQFANPPEHEIMFTNYIGKGQFVQPEENFMKVTGPANPMIKWWIEQEIRKWDRWRQCRQRQCFIVICQKHTNDQSWKKP